MAEARLYLRTRARRSARLAAQDSPGLSTEHRRSQGTTLNLAFRVALHARLRASARAAIATSARSASFTDFESGKAPANSGSRSTTLVPRRYLSTYLPRTPPEKSYSALISRLRRLEGGFFIVTSLMLRRLACAAQADPLSSNRRLSLSLRFGRCPPWAAVRRRPLRARPVGRTASGNRRTKFINALPAPA